MLLVKEPRSGFAHTVSSNMLSIDSQVNQHKTILYRGVATETACNPRVITEEPNNLRQAFAIEAVSWSSWPVVLALGQACQFNSCFYSALQPLRVTVTPMVLHHLDCIPCPCTGGDCGEIQTLSNYFSQTRFVILSQAPIGSKLGCYRQMPCNTKVE